MRKLTLLWGALLSFCAVTPVYAATLTVTTDNDEANCNCSGLGCSPNASCVRTTGSYKLSTGCSLREILQNIVDVNAPNPISYPECTPAPTAGGANTIELGSHTIVVNSTVPLASDSTGVATTNNGSLNILSVASDGVLTIQHGTALSCFTNPSAMPAITLNTMFDVAVGGDVTFNTVHFQNCTTQSGTAAGIWAKGSANLTLINGTTFTNLRSTGSGTGGCINHGNGNLTITGGTFSGCVVDNGSAIPGGGGGQGGAIYIAGVGTDSIATISGVAFTGNIAGESGGALYLSGTNAITISGAAFTGNFATGSTFAGNNAEFGGGAIFANNTANGSGSGIHVNEFLIFQSSFIGNQATQGTGGAILLTGGGSLTYGNAAINVGQYQIGNINGIPGGIVASNFSGNVAMGSWDTVNNGAVDPRAGSGGAIYANGNLSIVASSFVGSNASTNASGGAIALYDPSDNLSPMTISNSTFNSNSAAVGGGAIANLKSKFTSNSGKVTLINDTISGNSTGAGGGGSFNNGNGVPAEANVSNTIFDGGTGGNCAGNGFTNVAGNLQFNPASGCGSIANTGDPKLQSPTVFGGVNALVLVMKLNSGSAASGTANPAICTASPIFNLDEALNSRPQGKPNCDVGAFESGIVPDLTIAKSHTDPFTQGDIGDTYTITASNSGNDSTSGTVTVTDTLPAGAGLSATAMDGGPNWNCVLATKTCTRNDALASSASYEPITLTVNVAPNATPAVVINTATVAGGSEANTGNDTANDPTTIVGIPDLTITKQHVDPFTQGDVGDTYTITVSNSGTASTTGTVTVTDTLPAGAGLSATAISGGPSWNCTLATLTCTRSDALASGASYQPITLTVNVAANATPAVVTNTATVAGGSELNTGNDSVGDQTTIVGTTPVRLQSFSVD
jgi:uncharacterized repeat protein (TIGR01451 family)